MKNFLTLQVKWQIFTFSILLLTVLLIRRNIVSKSQMTEKYDNGVKTMNMESWKYVPGVINATKNSLDLNSVPMNIVNQDGSGGQQNPPIDVYGQHLKFDGLFRMRWPINRASDSDLEIRLYSNPPVIYDEWRLETPSIAFYISKNYLHIKLWDGSSEQPKTENKILLDSPLKELHIARDGDYISIFSGEIKLTQVSASKVLSTGKLWFGVSANAEGWQLGAISISGEHAQLENELNFGRTGSGLFKLVQNKNPNLHIGAAVSIYPLMTDPQYRTLALNEFSMWTTENELKSQFVHPQKETYAFGPADAIAEQATKNNIAIHGHALVFGEANPAWMQQAPLNERQEIMTNHITKLVKHYSGTIKEWDVINEPLSDDDKDYRSDGLRRHIWYQAMGRDYIEIAFRAARAANPDAKLYLNEYGLEEDGERWDALISLLKSLQSKGVPIDGIGFQSHIYESGDHVDQKVLRRHIQQLAEMNLLSRVSEIDVHGENSAIQAEQYSAVFDACFSSPSCTSFSTWGITDKYGSTTSDHTYPPEFGNDLIWNELYHEKPTLKSLRSRIL